MMRNASSPKPPVPQNLRLANPTTPSSPPTKQNDLIAQGSDNSKSSANEKDSTDRLFQRASPAPPKKKTLPPKVDLPEELSPRCETEEERLQRTNAAKQRNLGLQDKGRDAPTEGNKEQLKETEKKGDTALTKRQSKGKAEPQTAHRRDTDNDDNKDNVGRRRKRH